MGENKREHDSINVTVSFQTAHHHDDWQYIGISMANFLQNLIQNAQQITPSLITANIICNTDSQTLLNSPFHVYFMPLSNTVVVAYVTWKIMLLFLSQISICLCIIYEVHDQLSPRCHSLHDLFGQW